MLFGKPNANPNATAAKNALPGTVPGSTPPILLAATRGYYKVSYGWIPYVLFWFIRFIYVGHNLLLTTTMITKTKIFYSMAKYCDLINTHLPSISL